MIRDNIRRVEKRKLVKGLKVMIFLLFDDENNVDLLSGSTEQWSSLSKCFPMLFIS